MEGLNAWIFKNKSAHMELFHNDIDHLIICEPNIYKKWEKDFVKSTRPQKKSYMYLTLSPDKYLRNLDPTPSNIENLNKWCEKWFNQDKRFYDQFAWVIESGSNHDHLHVHAVMDMKQSKHHARDLKRYWEKFFPNNQLLTTLNLETRYKCERCQQNICKNPKHRGEYCYLQFNDEEILPDKLEYFVNEKKGTHSNQIDLGLRGCRGFLTDIS